MNFEIFKEKTEISAFSASLRNAGKKIAFVPTMGSLHRGHLSLIETAKKYVDDVIVSIFINPIQFAEGEDYEEYPRTIEQDKILLEEFNKQHDGIIKALYTPDATEMFSEDFMTNILVLEYSDILCGKLRPGHFEGVATIVLKLFNQIKPNYAIFGEKDFQQLFIIKKMCEDLDIDIEIIPSPIIREESGLAMSSRNQYLSEEQQEQAAEIFRMLSSLRYQISRSGISTEVLMWGQEYLLENDFTEVEYIEVREEETLFLAEQGELTTKCRIMVAAKLGETRLIDNMLVQNKSIQDHAE